MTPAFFVIGAMKCGTTSLYHYLREHPEICLSRIKETDFLLEQNLHKGLAWYRRLFAEPSLVCGEVSPNYSKRHLFPGVPERLAELAPRARLIYLVRDPLERIRSHYLHNLAKGRERRRSMAEAIREPESNYVQTSRYFYQLEAYRGHFPDERILLIKAEALDAARAPTLRSVLAFLGVDPEFHSPLFETRHHLAEEKLRSLADADRAAPEAPRLEAADRAFLRECLREDLTRLRAWSGQDFAEWSV